MEFVMKTVTSAHHPLIKYLIKLRDQRSFRQQEQRIMVEGKKMVEEIGKFQPIHTLLVTNPALIPDSITCNEVIVTTESLLKKISGTQQPEGIIALCSFPPFRHLKGLKKIIALDGVSDPGNVGTILRTALALGWEGAYLLEGCCDPFNDKALRAAKGATFHLPLMSGSWEQLKKISEENGWTRFVADLDGEAVDAIKQEEKILLVFGNETHGPSPETVKHCKKVTIPIQSQTDSLNVSVAAGILMYRWRKK